MGRNFVAMKDPQGYFSVEQIKRIVSNCQDIRNKLLLTLLHKSGRRVSEILMLQPEDIDFEDKMIVWNILKKPRDKKGNPLKRLKPIDNDTLAFLERYIVLKDINSFQRIFPISRIRAYQIVRKACEDVGIYQIGNKKPHPHHFRHSFSVHFVQKYGNGTETLRVLQQYLEHSDIGVTAGYLQYSQEHIREIMEKMWDN